MNDLVAKFKALPKYAQFAIAIVVMVVVGNVLTALVS